MEEYSTGFKVQTSREQIGVPLEKCRNNPDFSPNQALFIKDEKEITLIRKEKECELSLKKKKSTYTSLDGSEIVRVRSRNLA